MVLKKKNLLTGALILTVTGFILRGLGMVLRVLISSKLGEEGMGVYQLTQTVYFLFITLAQSGIAVALTHVMSARLAVGDKEGAGALMRSAIRLSLMLGGFGCIAMSALSLPVCKYWLCDMRCFYPIISLSLALPFIALCGVISAYFIVRSSPVYGCISQLIEQGLRIGFVFCLPRLTLTSLTLSGTVAEGVSCLFLILCYVKKRDKAVCRGGMRPLIREAAPIAASRYLASALHSVENVLVPGAITAFCHDRATALAQFGALKGMTLPLLFFPYSVLSAITTLIVPRLSGAQAKKDGAAVERTVSRAVSITLVLSVMVAGVFFTFADEIGLMIYNSRRVCYLIFCLAPIVPFMYLDSVCDGFLKGLGRQKQVLCHNCIDSVGRIILTALFVPRFGLDAFLGVMVVSNVSVSLMNLCTLCRAAGIRMRIFLRFFVAFGSAAASSILTKFLFKFSTTALNLALRCAFFCLIFGLFCILLILVGKKCKN